MWLHNSLVIIIVLLTVKSPADGHQPKETKLAMISAMKDLSSALDRMNESMSSMVTAVSDMSSAFNRMKHIYGISNSDFTDELKTGAEFIEAMNSKLSSAFADLEFQKEMSALFEEPENYYRLTHVSKRDTGDHYQITVDYIPFYIRPTVTMYREEYDVVYGGDRSIQELGKAIVNVPKTYDLEHVSVFFKFSLGVVIKLELILKNGTQEEMDIPRVLTSISPENGELVFEPETQPRLEVVLWTEQLDDVAVEDERVYPSFLLRSGEDELTAYYPWDDGPINLQILDLKERPGYHHWTYAINSSIPDPEGLLRLETEVFFVNCSSSSTGCPVIRLEIYQPFISFYRIDHAPPFPENFFGFVFYGSSLDFGTKNTTTCYTETECWVRCEAAWGDQKKNGSGIALEITEVTSDGNIVATDDIWKAKDAYSFSRLRVDNVTRADSGRVFRCTARSGQREISRDFELVIMKPPTVIEELSSVINYEFGSLATCVVEGFPRPNVTIEVYGYGEYSNDVISEKLNETTTKATVLVNETTTDFTCRFQQWDRTYYEQLPLNSTEEL